MNFITSLVMYNKLKKQESELVSQEDFTEFDVERATPVKQDTPVKQGTVERLETEPIVKGKFKVDPNYKNNKKKKNINIYSALLFLGTALFVCFMIFINIEKEPENYQYLKQDPQYSSRSIDNGLSARVIGHGRHHWLKCSDFDYGCCEVNYDSNGYNVSITLSVYKIVKHDPVGSNCPTIQTMVDGYNNLYDDHCSDTDKGCCMIDDYQINIQKDDYCPRERDIIHMYETNYEDFVVDYLTLLCIFGLIVSICCFTKK